MSTDMKDHTLVRPEHQKWLKGIGIYQVAGGAIGLIILVLALITVHTGPLSVLLTLPGVLLFALSIFAGIQCIRLNDACVKLSFINQTLQIISFSAGVFSFQYISGAAFEPHVSFSEGFSFIFQLNLSNYSLQINWGDDSSYSFGINLIAIGLVYKLHQVKTDYETALWRKEMDQKMSS